MIVAIFASGAHSMVGLYFAVAVAALNGIVWFLWGRAPSWDPAKNPRFSSGPWASRILGPPGDAVYTGPHWVSPAPRTRQCG